MGHVIRVHVVSCNPSLLIVAVGSGALPAAGSRAWNVEGGNVAVRTSQETVIHIIRVGVWPRNRPGGIDVIALGALAAAGAAPRTSKGVMSRSRVRT